MVCRLSGFAILLAIPLLLGSTAAGAEDLKSIVQRLGNNICPNSGFFCITRPVPVDHRANTGPTIDIEYAISFASNESKGVLFFVVGGPGRSGVAVAKEYLAKYDNKLKENMDIVFFDQRGIGRFHGVTCPQVEMSFKKAQPSVARQDETIAIAKQFAEECPRKFRSDELIHFLDTDQAVRDLELFRQEIGSPKIWIYGMSYGTQFAQRYATIFPTSVRGIIIDGVVDLTLSSPDYYESYVLAAEDLLKRVFKECRDLNPCSVDMKDDPAAVYDRLVAKATVQPIEIDFPKEDGGFEKRKLTAIMLEQTAYDALFSMDDRATLLRALAAASRDNLVPLLLLGYSWLGVDPETQKVEPDSTWYGAAYYAITCSDYGEGTENADETAKTIITDARGFSPKAPRFLDLYYLERLACAFWPQRGPAVRPPEFAGGEFPTLVLNADADPITPIAMAKSVFRQVRDNAFLITTHGGSHVIWSSDPCVDNPVYDLLLEGKTPERRVTDCESKLIGDYAPLTLTDAASADDPLAVVLAVETELWESLALSNWDQESVFTVGCDFGGKVTASAEGRTTSNYDFRDCAWWPGIRLTGKGKIIVEEDSDSIALDLAVAGDHDGTLVYRREGDSSNQTLTGTYDGNDVSIP